MNTLFDCVCALARDKAARGGNHVTFRLAEDTVRVPSLRYTDGRDGFLGRTRLDHVMNIGYSWFVTYPSGLILSLPCIPWLWTIPRETPRLGTAEQAWRYAQERNIDPTRVETVEHDRVHGLCVRDEHALVSKRYESYRFIEARPFPEWTR